ncbi:MAG TPA: bifunctional 4-hydroxy-2-oxoglutarate aldolase/2-dehydro-3-deoxy-phosphogluconate aldolase [Parafilimonas sp.]|jgi:2-dehydro-3-deoxyphosphogluconate aldolase/(4S)-4-hydroxy-2-oxoglutarate aldolase|nr:bifunctional 4-hydroxy-2-oxoglutarate aldolase/2-dehydro-3-deoxy-phosphogluconate aldolase [Parafilimonas sp.]
MNKKYAIQQLICAEKILPLFYHDSADTSVEVLKVLYESGIKAVEYTNRGDNALDNFTAMRKVVDDEMPGMHLGAGTIKTDADAELFVAAGADFIVCPVLNVDVGIIVHKAGLLWIPGCMTSSEIFIAETNGASIVKIFPGNILGPSYIPAIKELFPELMFMPTGGVEVNRENLQSWFKAGVCAVGLGSKLISKPDLDNKNYDKIAALSKEALEIVQGL